MLFNYLKLSLRLLARNPFLTFINIVGLSVGFSVFLILWQHATYELHSDQFHKDYDRIYRLYNDFAFLEGENLNHYIYSTNPPILASLVKEQHPEIEALTRLIHQKRFNYVRWRGPQTDTAGYNELSTTVTLSRVTSQGEKINFKEFKAAFADPNFFEFFSIPLIEGRPESALSRMDALVLSNSTALKYFGSEEPLGKVLRLNNQESYTVTGIFADLPDNSHLTFDFLFSTLSIAEAMETADPMQESAVNYLKLSPSANIPDLERAFDAECEVHWSFIKDHFPGSTWKFQLQPLSEAAFHVFENDNYSPKSLMKLRLFLIVGIVVLSMAWINYLNLKLSTQATRMKELGVRAASGARVINFISQFLVESVLINSASVLLSLTLIQLLKSPLQVFFQFYVPDWTHVSYETVAVFLAVMAAGMFIAGLHPALTFWKLTLRSTLSYGKASGEGRNFIKLTSIVQFSIATILIVWLSTVNQQVQFVIHNSWGLNRERVVVLDIPLYDSLMGTHPNVRSLKNELLAISGVEDATVSTTVVGDMIRHRVGFFPGDHHGVWAVPKSDGGVDERFVPFYGLKILAGRNFTGDASSDRNAVILSREAAKSVGWEPDEAVGQRIDVERYSWRDLRSPGVVIGVIEDHRHSPLYRETTMSNANRGTLLTYGNYLFRRSYPAKMSIRLSGSTSTMAAVGEAFQRIFPREIFHWYFLDDHMNRLYENEEIALHQISLFTAIAIGVACLGLLGMITNRMVEKTKEIGVRKVLGARLHQIGYVLLSATMKQALIASGIGVPVAYLLTQLYLEKFVERVPLPWWQYVVPIGILLVTMFSTVVSVLWKAANANPVKALKCE